MDQRYVDAATSALQAGLALDNGTFSNSHRITERLTRYHRNTPSTAQWTMLNPLIADLATQPTTFTIPLADDQYQVTKATHAGTKLLYGNIPSILIGSLTGGPRIPLLPEYSWIIQDYQGRYWLASAKSISAALGDEW